MSLLRPLTDACRAQYDKLSLCLNEQVHTLDVEQFYDGPNDLVPKLGRMSARGRNNRRQLKACSLNGDLSDEVVASLPATRVWKQTIAEIRALEPVQRSVLGSTYWRAEQTDLNALEQAIQVAQRAVEIIGDRNTSDGVRRELVRGSVGASTTAALADEVRRKQAQLVEAISEGELRSALAILPINEIAPRCAAGQLEVAELVGLLEAIEDAGASSTTLGTGLTLLNLVAAQNAADTAFTQLGTSAPAAFAPWWKGRATSWTELELALAWSAKLAELVGHQSAPVTPPCFFQPPSTRQVLSRRFDGTRRHSKPSLQSPTERAAQMRQESVASLESAGEQLEYLCNTTGDIQEWREFVTAKSRLTGAGLGSVVEFAEQQLTDGAQIRRPSSNVRFSPPGSTRSWRPTTICTRSSRGNVICSSTSSRSWTGRR